MNVLTKLFVLAWVGIGAVLGAHYAGVAAADGAAAVLLSYSGLVSPVSAFGAATALFLVIDWRMGAARVRREEAAIIRDKPALANNKKALRRERRVREKELMLQRREEKALKKENRAERRIADAARKENKLERRRETIEMKKEELREREQLGR